MLRKGRCFDICLIFLYSSFYYKYYLFFGRLNVDGRKSSFFVPNIKNLFNKIKFPLGHLLLVKRQLYIRWIFLRLLIH